MSIKKSLISEKKYYGNWKKFLTEEQEYRSLDRRHVVEVWERLIGGCAGLSSMPGGRGGMLQGIETLLDELSKEYGREIEESDIEKRDLYPGYHPDVIVVRMQSGDHTPENRFMLKGDYEKCKADQESGSPAAVTQKYLQQIR
tara:strand:- start:47 stop:475 length:429 start_codon:yes stop_codon:yes gene_type:complete